MAQQREIVDVFLCHNGADKDWGLDLRDCSAGLSSRQDLFAKVHAGDDV